MQMALVVLIEKEKKVKVVACFPEDVYDAKRFLLFIYFSNIHSSENYFCVVI